MAGLSKKNLLVQIMGSDEWNIVSLQEEYNKKRRRGICTRELASLLSRHREFHVVGETSVTQGWIRQTPKNGYKLYEVKEEFRGF